MTIGQKNKKRQWLRAVFSAFLVVVILLAGLLAALPYLVSTDSIRIRLAQDLSVWTGYNVQLHTPPKLTFFPRFQASLEGVTLSSNEAGAVPLMEAERIDVDLSWVRALMGEIAFSETRIVRPRFVMDEPLQTTADFLISLSNSSGTFGQALARAREVVTQNPEFPDETKLLAQPFGRIMIENGTLTYHVSENEQEQLISDISATIDWPDSNRAADFRLQGRWHGELTELRIDADQALLLLAGGQSPMRISVNSKRGGATLTGQARLMGNVFFDGRLAARSPGLNQTLRWLGLQRLFGVGLNAPIVWESSLNILPERIQMNDVSFRLGEDNARGAMEINHQSELTVTTGSLAFQSLDMNLLATAFFPAEDSSELLDLTLLDHLGLDLRLSAPEAQLGQTKLHDLAAAIQIRNGQGIFDIGNVSAFGGSLQSNIQLSRSGSHSFIEARVSGSNVELGGLAPAFDLPSGISGPANFILSMKAPFTRWSDIGYELDGNIVVNGNRGTLKGFDLSGLEGALADPAPILLSKNKDAQFNFGRFNIEARLEDGQANVTKAIVRFDHRQLMFNGLLPFRPSRDVLIGERGLALDMMLVPENYSSDMCIQADCVMASLQAPKVMFLSGDFNQPILIHSPSQLFAAAP